MDKESLAIFGVMFLLCAALFGGMVILSEKECEAKTVSFTSYYSLMSGCMIEVDGRYIPLANYREI